MNIPIYRAKKTDSDEWIEGYYIQNHKTSEEYLEKVDEVVQNDETEHLIIDYLYQDMEVDEETYYNFMGMRKIDPNTLSIHFPNMLDKNGKKIFASLSEDGVGGDVFEAYMPNNFDNKNKYVAKVTPFGGFNIFGNLKDIEVIGIHKGE